METQQEKDVNIESPRQAFVLRRGKRAKFEIDGVLLWFQLSSQETSLAELCETLHSQSVIMKSANHRL